MLRRIEWAKVRAAIWSPPGVAAILMAPNALPIAFWFFETASPIDYNFETASGLDMFGQALLALLVGTFAVITGVAIDLGLVKIAVSPPTHTHRFKSLTFWIPVVFCVALWTIQYDYYSDHKWVWDMSTFTHLFYPTASMFTALYWSWSKDWGEELAAPYQSQIDYLSRQVRLWVDRFDVQLERATQELIAQVEELKGSVSALIKRAETAELFNRQFNTILEQLNEGHAQTLRDLRGTHVRAQESIQSTVGLKAQTEIDRLKDEHIKRVEHIGVEWRNEINQLKAQHVETLQVKQREVERLTGSFDAMRQEINDLKQRQVTPGTFRFLTMKDAIEDYIRTHGDPGTPQLIAQLGIKDEDIATFRSQVSQVRKKLPGAIVADSE